MTELHIPGRVWLTSFWGWNPEEWGGVGWSTEGRRNAFLREAGPGSLVAVYVTKDAKDSELRGKLAGLYEISDRVGDLSEFLTEDALEERRRDLGGDSKWSFAVGASRAWTIIDPPKIEKVASATYSYGKARTIGSLGKLLAQPEIEVLSKLRVMEVPVAGQAADSAIDTKPSSLNRKFKPSRAVPPSGGHRGWIETPGPKHLYVLRMQGSVADYFGANASKYVAGEVYKVGYSKSPIGRCATFQNHLPGNGQFEWEIHKSTANDGGPVPNADIAIAGEDELKKHLEIHGESLGREFFFASSGVVSDAWQTALKAIR